MTTSYGTPLPPRPQETEIDEAAELAARSTREQLARDVSRHFDGNRDNLDGAQ